MRFEWPNPRPRDARGRVSARRRGSAGGWAERRGSEGSGNDLSRRLGGMLSRSQTTASNQPSRTGRADQVRLQQPARGGAPAPGGVAVEGVEEWVGCEKAI